MHHEVLLRRIALRNQERHGGQGILVDLQLAAGFPVMAIPLQKPNKQERVYTLLAIRKRMILNHE